MKTLAAWLMLLALSTTGVGQEIRLNAPRFAMLVNQAALKELKLDADQQKQVDGLLGDYIQEVDGEKRLVIRGSVDFEELDSNINKILKPQQQKRLKEAWLQLNGPMALTDTAVAKEVQLTEDQSKKITEAVTSMNQGMRDIFQESGGDQQKMREGVIRLRGETAKLIEGMLSADQKKKLEAMKGAKIDNLLSDKRK